MKSWLKIRISQMFKFSIVATLLVCLVPQNAFASSSVSDVSTDFKSRENKKIEDNIIVQVKQLPEKEFEPTEGFTHEMIKELKAIAAEAIATKKTEGNSGVNPTDDLWQYQEV